MPSAGMWHLVSSTNLANDGWVAYPSATAIIWTTFHLPFIMAYVLAGASLSRLVLATDCHDANLDNLTEAYTGSSKPEISSGLRFFYCVGLGVALISMSMSLTSLQCVHWQLHILTSDQASYRCATSIKSLMASGLGSVTGSPFDSPWPSFSSSSH